MDTDYTLTTNYYMPADAVIWMSGARDCVVRDCTFRHVGGYALRLDEQSHRVQFVKNRVQEVGQGGVILVGDNHSQPHHNLIAGNVMKQLGLVYKHVAGVYVITGNDNRIAHNTIWDTPRYAISLKTLDETRQSHRNTVEYNDLRRTNLETNDTGAIETLGRDQQDTGNIIRYNLILDSVGMTSTPDGRIITPYFSWGIYLDDYSSGTTVYGQHRGAYGERGYLRTRGQKQPVREQHLSGCLGRTDPPAAPRRLHAGQPLCAQHRGLLEARSIAYLLMGHPA
jgi:hypothetical protein